MAKAVQKQTRKNSGKDKAPKPLSPKQMHANVTSLLAGKALTGKAAEAFAVEAISAAAPTAVKAITFTCSNPGCLVAITSGLIHFVFSASGGANFPVGTSTVFHGVQGPPNQPFAITIQGGTLDFPINGTLSPQGKAGGMRKLTVNS